MISGKKLNRYSTVRIYNSNRDVMFYYGSIEGYPLINYSIFTLWGVSAPEIILEALNPIALIISVIF